MTPTPEEIAMAERIANSKHDILGNADWWRSRDVALTAIMEAKKKPWTYEVQIGPDGEAIYAHVFDSERLVCVMRTHDAIKVADAIRNGEHLR